MNDDLKTRALARWEGEGGLPRKPSPLSLKDPVCGTTVTEQSPHRHEHAGRTYFFCSEKCRGKLAGDPASYLAPLAEAPAETGSVYLCPMHPEIRGNQPGACPKCGMALGPEPQHAT